MVEINKKYKFQIGAYGNPFEGEVLGKTEKAFKVKLDKIITKLDKDVIWIPFSVIEDNEYNGVILLKSFYKFS